MYELSTKLPGIKKLQVLYKGPEWHPSTYTPPATKKPSKYNTGADLPYLTWLYVGMQFGIVVVGRKQLEINFDILSHLSLAFLVIFLVWTLISVGMILQKQLTINTEYLRILLSGAMLFYVAWQASRPAFFYGIAIWGVGSLLLFPMCIYPYKKVQ